MSTVDPGKKSDQGNGENCARGYQDQHARATRWYLQNVLPLPASDEEGCIVIAVQKADGPWLHQSVRSIEEAYQLIRRVATDVNVRGVFAAQARMRGMRNSENALAFSSVWLDLDAKDFQQPGDDAAAAIQRVLGDLEKFVASIGLPQPSVIVGSGGGAHCYWLFTQPVGKELWRNIAQALRSCVEHEKLPADITCTTDAARILRVPGTYNRKSEYSEPRLVEILHPKAGDPVRYKPEDIQDPLVRYLQSNNSGSGQKMPVAVDEPGGGPESHWFHPLPPELKNQALDHALEMIATRTKYLELEQHGGNNHEYYRLMQACARSGAPGAEDLWIKWASKAHGADPEDKLRADFSRCLQASTRADGVTVGTLLYMAQQHSANFDKWRQVKFRDFYKDGRPRPSLANAVIAIRALGIQASYDMFANRTKLTYNGNAHTIQEGLLTDNGVSAVRSLINNTYRIDCGDDKTFAALKEVALDNAYDPMLDLLEECQGKWDRTKRLDTWVIHYLGCKDTPLNRAIGRIVLIAACRRARKPGCKFDNITILEGFEETGKSTAIRVLAGDEYFSDQSILGAKDREVQEHLEGIWMHESADLAGMKRADVEQVKAFASRQVDRGRRAYGRVREDCPRRSIEWGTTNNKQYLLSQTGNRRFWPLETGRIDIEALKRDREQLLGEAATYEAAGESIALDRKLWPAARDAQEQRRVADPWEDILANIPDTVRVLGEEHTMVTVPIIHRTGDGFERVASTELLEHVLKIPKAQQNSTHGQRLARAMEHVGWDRNETGRVTINGKPARGYIRPIYRASSSNQFSGKVTGRLIKGPWGALPIQVSGVSPHVSELFSDAGINGSTSYRLRYSRRLHTP